MITSVFLHLRKIKVRGHSGPSENSKIRKEVVFMKDLRLVRN